MAYTPPIAKNGVYFTRNLTESNRKTGEALIARYFRNSVLSKAPYYPITNYDAYVKWLDTNYPTFIEYLGDAVNQYGIDKMYKIIDAVAKKGEVSYPRPSSYSNSMMTLYGNGIDVAQVLSDTASDVGNAVVDFTTGTFKTLLVIGFIVFAVVLYQKSGGKMPKLPKVSK